MTRLTRKAVMPAHIDSARQVAVYLNTLASVQPGAMAIALEIKGAVYLGAVYRPNADDSTNPHYHQADRFYLLGALPPCKIRRSRTCFTMVNEEGDPAQFEAFIAAHCDRQTANSPAYSAYHPFGASFSIQYWCFDDCKIDSYESTPYQRIDAHIVSLDALC